MYVTFCKLLVSIESHPSREQYRSWLENIGFEEDIVGEKVGFKLGQVYIPYTNWLSHKCRRSCNVLINFCKIVFDELKRSLQEAIRTPALQATKLSQGSDFTMAVEMGPNRKEPSGCVNTCISGNSAGICSEDIRMSDVDFNVVTSSHAIESESIRGLRLQDPISMKSPRGNFGGFVPVDTRSTDYAAVVGCAHLTAPSPSFVLANDFSQFKISSSSPRHPLVATSRTDAPVPIPPFGPNYTTGIVCGPDRGSDDRGAFGSVPRTALQSCPTGADTGIESGDFRVPQWSEGLTLAHDTLRQISEVRKYMRSYWLTTIIVILCIFMLRNNESTPLDRRFTRRGSSFTRWRWRRRHHENRAGSREQWCVSLYILLHFLLHSFFISCARPGCNSFLYFALLSLNR